MKKTLFAAALLFAAAPAYAQMMPETKTMETGKGAVLADAKGMTLYTFDKDKDGKSACNGGCATNWPPLMAKADAKGSGAWSVITRDDGSKMWAHKGMPVYTWIKDTKPGDTTGDGVGGAWHIAKP